MEHAGYELCDGSVECGGFDMYSWLCMRRRSTCDKRSDVGERGSGGFAEIGVVECSGFAACNGYD